MSWLKKLIPPRIKKAGFLKKGVPEGIWNKCENCGAVLYKEDFLKYFKVCPKCKFHNRISARERINYLLDKDHRFEISENLESKDFLKFVDTKKYSDRLKAAQKKTKEKDALVTIAGEINNTPVVVAAFEFNFLGGSMGSVVGEKFVRAVNYASKKYQPFICFSSSGGARMQEGLSSLFQMSKTVAAITLLSKKKIPFISVLTDPTMGGVSASFSMIADIVISEPNALIGFAGPRVIEQTVGQKLPDGFQKAEFLLKHGAIDKIVDRRDMKNELQKIIDFLTKDQ